MICVVIPGHIEGKAVDVGWLGQLVGFLKPRPVSKVVPVQAVTLGIRLDEVILYKVRLKSLYFVCSYNIVDQKYVQIFVFLCFFVYLCFV